MDTRLINTQHIKARNAGGGTELKHNQKSDFNRFETALFKAYLAETMIPIKTSHVTVRKALATRKEGLAASIFFFFLIFMLVLTTD